MKIEKLLENYLLGENSPERTEECPFLDKIVVVRTYSAGVYYGRLKYINKESCYLEKARMIYRWKGGALSLLDLAKNNAKEIELTTSRNVFLTNCIAVIELEENILKKWEGLPDVKV